MEEKAHLIIKIPVKGAPFVYQCSLCAQLFPLASDGTVKESMARLWAAFKDHIRESHESSGDI
jgi:hypothetical protein